MTPLSLLADSDGMPARIAQTASLTQANYSAEPIEFQVQTRV
jgi:hypothetical protein